MAARFNVVASMSGKQNRVGNSQTGEWLDRTCSVRCAGVSKLIGAPFPCLLQTLSSASFFAVTVLFATMPANCTATTQPPQNYREHFAGGLAIDKCIFEHVTYSFGAQTNLYEARYQSNAFVVRKIESAGWGVTNQITTAGMCAGGNRGNYWAIEGGRVLKLFPNADSSLRKMDNPETSLIEAPRRILIGGLFYGLHLIDPTSVSWASDTEFVGSSFTGHRYRGEIKDMAEGKPVVIRWYAEEDPSIGFTTECKYARPLALSHYPSDIFVSAKVNGIMHPVSSYKILAMETSVSPIDSNSFEPGQFLPSDGPSVTLVITNDHLYTRLSDGRLERVLSAPPSSQLYGGQPFSASSRWMVMLFIVVSSAFWAFILWWSTKQKTNK